RRIELAVVEVLDRLGPRRGIRGCDSRGRLRGWGRLGRRRRVEQHLPVTPVDLPFLMGEAFGAENAEERLGFERRQEAQALSRPQSGDGPHDLLEGLAARAQDGPDVQVYELWCHHRSPSMVSI